MMPNAVAYCEGRVYRELDMVALRFTSETTFSAGDRNLTLPFANLITIETLNVITPVGALADAGTRNMLIPTTREFIDMAWPSVTSAALPIYFAVVGQNYQAGTQIVVGPFPDE